MAKIYVIVIVVTDFVLNLIIGGVVMMSDYVAEMMMKTSSFALCGFSSKFYLVLALFLLVLLFDDAFGIRSHTHTPVYVW